MKLGLKSYNYTKYTFEELQFQAGTGNQSKSSAIVVRVNIIPHSRKLTAPPLEEVVRPGAQTFRYPVFGIIYALTRVRDWSACR